MDIRREGMEYESRLFGGAYSASRLRTAAKDAPIREMIRNGRARYNEIRQALNLPVVENWDVRPEQLVQHVNVE